MMDETPTTQFTPDNLRQALRTLVVDDSVVLLEHVCRFLKTQPMIKVVGTAAHGNDALHLAEALRPDLVLMDMNMPLLDGFQATAILSRRFPDIRVIIMTIDGSVSAQASARSHGAHGFVWKPRIISELMIEIHRVFLMYPSKDERNPL